jgi:hypothetical protein
MSIFINQLTLNTFDGEVRTHGSVGNRFGSARKCGGVSLYQWDGHVLRPTVNFKCSTYRKAQRKLLQWLKGYTVC